jgi:hypothetical protein
VSVVILSGKIRDMHCVPSAASIGNELIRNAGGQINLDSLAKRVMLVL